MSEPQAPPAPRLAEVQWTWRRLFSFSLVAACMWLVREIIDRANDPGVQKTLGLALCGLVALQALLYVAGAMATDIARIIEARGRGK